MAKDEWLGCWAGRTVVCIGSGPSLTEEDCELVRLSGHPAIVTNTTFRRCPWADVLFAFDGKWWTVYRDEVDSVFKGRKVTASRQVKGVDSMTRHLWFKAFGNSGTGAISLAVAGKAAKVVMIGFDAQATDGKLHWHGDHPPALSNAKSIGRWSLKFENVAQYAKRKGVRVVNCSRVTALQSFERGILGHEL